ncbi:Asp-tRNA(Asn)/Glu-tRNA(Gln) amidotransferase subunit GatA [candidate division KSB1 bacterium]|nr:Asp-tRNA(Asn)/Glu-tRNA(Gln) amidotransferase subunit GatA [candidate division KSB1 bacterium]RQW00426.1 MAG: Asp-tRNA(Asn)/Glu-tRNA(Gln) amidotransferase subunit GatA [candidate division KSB1 bacterium]
MDLTTFDYQKLEDKIKTRELSCVDVTRAYLDKIEAARSLNAFISVYKNDALKRAEQVDKKIAANKAGQLAGLVLAVKDVLVVKGGRTTCASKVLSSFISPYDATVIEKLKAQDVIFIGKTNMDEFAMGSSNESSYFGPVKNPRDMDRVPGGSSGGSAAAVAGDLCVAALGSDTGGSIRQPASFCGVVGLKPTYGRVSRFGLVAYASSLDQIGPITKSVSDAARLLTFISGHDHRDSTSANLPVDDYMSYLDQDVKGLRIGLPKEYFAAGLDPQVEKPIREHIDVLQAAGAEIIHVSLPHTEYAIAAYYIIATAEASSNLARFDGARYGVRAQGVKDLEEMYIHSRTQGFGREVKRRIMLGTYVLSSGYYDAYYRKAQKVRTLVKDDFERALSDVDCLLTPVAPTTAFRLNEKLDDPLTMYLSDVYTVSVNLAGLPGISIPCGMDVSGLPVGLQLVGKPFDEGTIIRVADFLEKSH